MRGQFFIALSLCLSVVSSVHGDKKKSEEAAETTLNGILEAVQATEVTAGTEKLNSLVIDRILPHGQPVRKGQTLVWFGTEDIDEKIRDAEISLRLSKLTLSEDEFAFRQFQETQKLDRSAAERTWKTARQTYDNYKRIDRDRDVESAEYSLKSAQESLENVAEELKQLEQMYKEDELTEESEEIVLKRARSAVESAEFRLRGTRIQTERTLQQSIPQQTAQHEDALARAELRYRQTMKTLEVARQKQEIDIDRKRDRFRKEEAELVKMQAERKRLVLTAAHDGIIYHGELTRGKLSDKPAALKKGTTVTGDQVIATVVNPSQLQVRLDLTDVQRSQLAVGMQGTVSPAAFPDHSLSGRIKSVDIVPFANNKFDCVVAIKGKVAGLAPATNCVVTIPGTEQKE